MHRIIKAFPRVDISNGYGMTEAAPLITTLGPAYHRADFAKRDKLRAVGWPAKHVEVRVVDEDGANCPVAGRVKLCCAGPM